MTDVGDHPVNGAIDLLSGAFWGHNPDDELLWMRENAPVYWDGRVWGIARHADVKAISKEAGRFSNAGGIRPDFPPLPMMIEMDDPEHWRRRKLVNRGFTPKRVPAMVAFAEYSEYAGRVIADRRDKPRDDLMSELVHAHLDGDRLDHDSLVQESLLILIGGDETTRHVISGGGWPVLHDRDRWLHLAADPGRIPAAVEEMLRWVSPIKNMARTVMENTTVGGQTLAQGAKVLLLYRSANRDAEVFDDPFTFDVGREPNDHLAFGFGAHFCLGNSLARLELRVMFEQLLSRLPDLELVDEAEPSYRAANFISGYESMPVRFSPSAPVSAT